MDINKIWETAKLSIADRVSSVSFDLWIRTLVPESFENGTFILSAPSTMAKQQAGKEMHFAHIEQQIKETAPVVEKVSIIDAIEKEARAGITPPEKKATPKDELKVNPKMTFENFIVGKSNEIVAAAAEAAANEPGKRINPLFIYGRSGLGKTHLLNAIANRVMQNTPSANIVLATCQKFVNDFVENIKNKDKPWAAFREKYRNVDILLIDDIQDLAKKPGTQEEFFHTFNDLFQNGRQIVLTSDVHADEIATLAERMRSRFKSGLIQDIGNPDVEMLVAILQKKASLENYRLKDEVISHLAAHAADKNMNVRDMEGMLAKVIFYAGLMNKSDPTIEDCIAALKETNEDKKIQTTADTIIGQVCKYFNISKEDIISKKRNREVVEPRMFAIYLITEFLNIPLVSIGQILGNRDHTTVLHARNKIAAQLGSDQRTKRIVGDISKLIRSE